MAKIFELSFILIVTIALGVASITGAENGTTDTANTTTIEVEAEVQPCNWHRVADSHGDPPRSVCLDENRSCSDICYTIDDDTRRAACLHQCLLAFNRCIGN